MVESTWSGVCLFLQVWLSGFVGKPLVNVIFESETDSRQHRHKNSATCIIVEFTAMGGQRKNLISVYYGSIIRLDKLEIVGEQMTKYIAIAVCSIATISAIQEGFYVITDSELRRANSNFVG